jgi:hypothetical protein
METKQITVCCGEWKTVTECVPGGCVTRKCRLPDTCCFDPCTCKAKKIKGETVCYTEQLPPKTVCKKVWVPRQEVRNVQVTRMVQEQVVENVPVTTCRWVHEKVVKHVPVCVCEKVPVCVTENVCRRVKVKVPVCEMECKKPHFLSRLFSRFHDRCDDCNTCGASPCCGHGPHGAPAGPALQPVPAAPAAEPMPAPKSE